MKAVDFVDLHNESLLGWCGSAVVQSDSFGDRAGAASASANGTSSENESSETKENAVTQKCRHAKLRCWVLNSGY
jgi:hypothetical protein